MKYLITGGGIHARRYTEALLFQKSRNEVSVYCSTDSLCYDQIRQYGVPIISGCEMKQVASQTDCIILADLPEHRLDPLDILLEIPSNASYIVEKPSSVCMDDEKQLQQFLKGKRWLIAYSRFFLSDMKKEILHAAADSTHISVTWPNFSNLGIVPIRDTLPHALDLLLILTAGKMPLKYEVIPLEQGVTVNASDGVRSINIQIYHSEEQTDCVMLNGCRLSWPNYFKAIQAMVDQLLVGNAQLFDENHMLNEFINTIAFSVNNHFRKEDVS